jgi:hypothetical protein
MIFGLKSTGATYQEAINGKCLKEYYPSVSINTWQLICSIIGSNSRYQKGITFSSKTNPKKGKVDTICIAYRAKNQNRNDYGIHKTFQKVHYDMIREKQSFYSLISLL